MQPHDNLYILGNFNLHLDNSTGITNKFYEILTSSNSSDMVICQATFMATG